MSDFGPWLYLRADEDNELRELKALASEQSADWPYYSNALDDYVSFVRRHASQDSQERMLASLSSAFSAWAAQAKDGERGRGLWTWLSLNFAKLILAVAGILLAIGLALGLSKGSFLQDLAEPSAARGLITLLFSVGTIAVSLLIAVALFWVPKAELDDRFSRAKDLLAILVGILGTIIGFYFGSAQTEVSNRPPVSQTDGASSQNNGTDQNPDTAQ